MIDIEQLSIGPLEDDEDDDGDDIFEPVARNIRPRDLAQRIERFEFDINPLGRAPNSAYHAVGLATYHSNLMAAASVFATDDLSEEEEEEEEEEEQEQEQEQEQEEQTALTGLSLTKTETGVLAALLVFSSNFEPPTEESDRSIVQFFEKRARVIFEIIRFGIEFSKLDLDAEGSLMERVLDPASLSSIAARSDFGNDTRTLDFVVDDLRERALIGLRCAKMVFDKIDVGKRLDMKTAFEALKSDQQPFSSRRSPEEANAAKASRRGKSNRPR